MSKVRWWSNLLYRAVERVNKYSCNLLSTIFGTYKKWLNKYKFYLEFPLWLNGLHTQLVSMRMWVQSLTSFSGLRIWHGHIGHRCSLDLALLWLWRRLPAAAPVQPLAQELPYAAGAALKRKKQKQTNKNQCDEKDLITSHLLVTWTKEWLQDWY